MYWMGEKVTWLYDQIAMSTYIPYPLPKGFRWYVTDENGEQLYPDDDPILPHAIFSGANEALTRDSWGNVRTSEFWAMKGEITLSQYFPNLVYTNIDKVKKVVGTNAHMNKAVILNEDGTIGEDVTAKLLSRDCDIPDGTDILILISRVLRIPMFMVSEMAMSRYSVDELMMCWNRYGATTNMLYKLVGIINERFGWNSLAR